MADKTPAEKLHLKSGMSAALLHVPRDLEGKLGIPAEVTTFREATDAQFVLEFARTQAEAEARLAALAGQVGEKTVAWIAYPKGSRAAGHDLNRDTVAAYARTVGLVAVSNVAIDDTWSALRIRPLRAGE